MENLDYAFLMRGVHKHFGPVQALSDVSLSVRKGTVHALVGENGAGKSTLMKILAGVYRPDKGQIEINSRVKHFHNPSDALAAGVSMIYQELDLAEHLTAAENIFLGMEHKGWMPFAINRDKAVEETEKLCRRYGFEVESNKKIEEMTVAQAQVVEMLKALVRKSSIIVMDEPTAALTEEQTEKLFKIVKTLRDEGISIIYISHRLEEIVDLADDITVLRDGCVVHTGSMKGIELDDIIRHMVGRELKDFYPQRNVQRGDVCLEVQSLSSKKGISDISFSVHQGEVVGIAGLIGAGRTELANAMFGIDKLTSGEITLNGRKLKINSPDNAVKEGLALLTEDRKRTGLCLDLSCVANVTLSLLCKKESGFLVRPVKELQSVSELGKKLKIKWPNASAVASALSGGNQQKLLIARWLLTNAELFIFDEPTRGVDVGAKKEIYTLINSLVADGKAVLMISSELPELLAVADRILVMRRGKLAGELKKDEADAQKVMRLAALGE